MYQIIFLYFRSYFYIKSYFYILGHISIANHFFIDVLPHIPSSVACI